MTPKDFNPRVQVSLVGAGPGDAGLLTLKGKQALEQADVIVYDQLANPELLQLAKPTAEKIHVGKYAGHHTMPQAEINRLLLEKARQGHYVVRLKGGDPFVFGRGGEEVEFLQDNACTFEVIPGITSAVAVPAYAGIPVTHRDYTSTLTLITGHEADKEQSQLQWEQFAPGKGTLVFFMGLGNLADIVQKLLQYGRAPETPVAVISQGTRNTQQTVWATLQDIIAKVQEAQLPTPALIVVGEVVRMREKLQWLEKKPLFGKKLLLTRSEEQNAELATQVRAWGGIPYSCPLIRIQPRRELPLLEEILQQHIRCDWVIFTSVNGVKLFFKALRCRRKDIRALGHCRIAAIGEKTAHTLEKYGVFADLVPAVYQAEHLAAALLPQLQPQQTILLPRASHTRKILQEAFTDANCIPLELPLYDTIAEKGKRQELCAALLPQMDYVLFGSSSAVTAFSEQLSPAEYQAIRRHNPGLKLAAIGSITAQTAAAAGFPADLVAEHYTFDALLEKIAEDARIHTKRGTNE